MTLYDFIVRACDEAGLTRDIAEKIGFLLITHSIEGPGQISTGKVRVDSKVFDKILLMKEHDIPEEIIYTVIKNSLDWDDNLDVRKFWRELGGWSKNLGMSQEEIKQDIDKYQSISHKKPVKIPIMKAMTYLEERGFRPDFIESLLDYMILPGDDLDHIYTSTKLVLALAHMHDDGWSEEDILRELRRSFDAETRIDTKKLERGLPKQLDFNKRKISKNDGSVKYVVSRVSFIKYINPVLKFFTDNANKIAELSAKYKEDNTGFARAFYDLYVNSRGWGDRAPKFVLDSDEKPSKHAGFSADGTVTLRDLSSQEQIVNTIIHELAHFEQYLMLINTPDISITPYAKKYIMDMLSKASGIYRKYDNESRAVFTGEDFEYLNAHDTVGLLPMAQALFENDFYRKALTIPHEKITSKSSEYAVVKELADSFMVTYDKDNHGNTVFEYPKLFSEQMAHDVGNAGAVMFRNVIMNEKGKSVTDLKNILDFATVQKFY